MALYKLCKSKPKQCKGARARTICLIILPMASGLKLSDHPRLVKKQSLACVCLQNESSDNPAPNMCVNIQEIIMIQRKLGNWTS